MRRKSERNKAKASPEKVEKEKPRRGRPSRKRKKSSSEEDAESAASGSEKDARQDAPVEGDQQWRVKAGGDPGHPHKLKICLARPTERSSDTETRTRRRDNPPPAPVEPEPERRRSRHRSRRVSNRDPEPEPEVEQEPEPVKEPTPEPIPEIVIEAPKSKAGKVKEIVEIQVESKIEPDVKAAKDEPVVEISNVEPVVEIPKVVPIKARKVEPVVEAAKVEPVKTRKVVEAPKDESVVKAEIVVEAPKVETTTKVDKVETVVEAPKAESIAEAPKVEPIVEAPKVELIVEARKTEPVIEVRKVETVVKAQKVEPVVEVPKVEPIIVSKAETTAEIISETKCVIKRKSEPKIEPVVVEKLVPVPTPVVPDQSCPVNIANESKTTEQPSVEKPVDSKPIETKKTPMDSTEKPSESATKISEKDQEIQTLIVESSEPKPVEKQNQSVDSQTCELVKKPEVIPETTSEADTNTKIEIHATNEKDVNSTTNENEPEKVISEETTNQSKTLSTKETPKVTNEKEIESPKSIPETIKEDNVKTKIVHNYQRSTGHRDATEEKHSKILTHKDKFSGVKEDRAEDKTESSENVSSNSSRKRKWGSRPKFTKTPSVNISTDSLKNLISNVEPVSVEEALSDIKPKDPPELKPKKIVLDDIKKPNGKYGVNDSSNEKEVIGSLSHRKISIVNDEIAKLHSPPSPPKYKSSTVLYITNLVRPFTLPQLKNLLQRTGRIVENGFWIDKIKSKCYVQYETEDEAIETRHALHGVTWPVSNPKTLNVDFGSKEAMDEVIASTDDDKTTVVDNWSKDSINRDMKVAGTEVDEKSFEKRTVVREWDLGKGDGKVEFLDRPNNRLREVNELERRKRRSSKSRSPSPARKFKKKEEEAPSKLLDDLFKKTKTTPCIYWLPLNAETILIKEEQRRKHMAEHERRMEELRKAAEEHRMSRHAPHHAPSHRHR